jgi:hypothetical protein
MKQTITVSSLEELRKFKTEFIEIRDIVKSANGKYIIFVEKHRDNSPAAQSMFITKREFDAALSPAMRTGSPAAFSPHIASGGFTPNRLNLAYSAYQRAQAQADITDTVPGSAMIRNREQFLAVYGERFGYFPPGRMGDFLNASVSEALK